MIDSGAQFAEGTTDITRTILVGEADEQMKADYTSVLRANICLATTIFPEGVSSQAIDAIAVVRFGKILPILGMGQDTV